MNEKFNLLSNDVNNKEDKIKEHCIELRRQVQLKTEQTLSKINELSESLINQIDTFEKDWIENLKAKSEFNTDHFEDLKTQVTQFSSEQSKYFQRIQLDEDKMNEANELAESYRSKIEQCLDEISVFVFNGKQFQFESSVLEMDEHFLGHFYARTFIDIKKFRTFCLNDEITDKKANSFYCVFIKPNDNYLIVYHIDSDNLVAITVDLLLNKIEKKIICVCLETYGFERSTSFIAFNFLNEDELDTLVVLDECSNIVSKCDFNGKNLISANDEFILCVDEDENITLYDWQLNTIDTKIKFQYDDPNKAFYLPAQLIDLAKFDNRQGRFIFSQCDCLSFIDESSGMVLKTITADYLDDVHFKINADNKLMFADSSELSSQKLIAYDLNGNLSYEIKLNGIESDFRFLFTSKNRIHFYDVELNKILYE